MRHLILLVLLIPAPAYSQTNTWVGQRVITHYGTVLKVGNAVDVRWQRGPVVGVHAHAVDVDLKVARIRGRTGALPDRRHALAGWLLRSVLQEYCWDCYWSGCWCYWSCYRRCR